MRARGGSQIELTRMSEMKAPCEPVPSGGGGRSPSAGASLALRLRVYLTRAKLDREIGSGCPCESTAALALRARQLTHASTRQQIARELREIVEYVDRSGPRPIDTAVVIVPGAVRVGREAIVGLAQKLEGSAAVEPAGIVLARRFLTDGLGPMSDPNSERTVAEAVGEVVDALEGHRSAVHDVRGHVN
jgi:hypothetical protein